MAKIRRICLFSTRMTKYIIFLLMYLKNKTISANVVIQSLNLRSWFIVLQKYKIFILGKKFTLGKKLSQLKIKKQASRSYIL